MMDPGVAHRPMVACDTDSERFAYERDVAAKERLAGRIRRPRRWWHFRRRDTRTSQP